MAAEPENLSLAASLLSAVVPRLRSVRLPAASAPAPAAVHGATVVCLCGAQGTVLRITPNAREVLGEACDRAAEFELSLGVVLQPEDPADFDRLMEQLRRLGDSETTSVDLLTRAPSGGPRWLEIWCRNLLHDITISGYLIEVRDVTLSRVDDKLRALLSAGMQHLPESVIVTDTAGIIRYVNPAFEQVTGYPAHEALGRTPALLKSGQHNPQVYEQLWRTVSAGHVWEGELCNRRKDGQCYAEQVRIAPVHDGKGVISHFLSAARDVSARKQAHGQAENAAYFDAITGTLRPRLLQERCLSQLALARRQGHTMALLRVTIDGLPDTADFSAQEMNDALRLCADRLRQALRDSDAVARLDDSNEFLVMLAEVAEEDATARVMRRLRDSLGQPLQIAHRSISAQPIIGAALYPLDAASYEELVASTELAVDRARTKSTGFEFFRQGLTELTSERLLLEEDFGWAWERKQFVMHYQPITTLQAGAESSNGLVGLEALARWPHLERGMVAPAQFIPLAQRTGRIIALDRWAIATATRQAASWAAGWNGWVSVNLSAFSLHDPELAQYLSSCLREHGVQPSRIVVEITERAAMRDMAITERVLGQLKDGGISIALDDFGVGHSSLAHLNNLPIDLLKLDRSIVCDIGVNPKVEQIVDLMITLAHRVGARALAKGVEYQEQLEWLRTAGCDLVQGFLLGRPQPPEGLEPGSWTGHARDPQAD